MPESLLSDRGTNLLSHLMTDLCRMLGVQKLNTTAYHPQCDGAVERFNRTLKTILRKHAARFGSQWDQYLHGVLWAYRNMPHSSTGEKPSFLLYGFDCRSTTAQPLPPPQVSDPIHGSIDVGGVGVSTVGTGLGWHQPPPPQRSQGVQENSSE